MPDDNNAVQNNILQNHETRIRQLETKYDEQNRTVVKLEVIIEQLVKRWDLLEERMLEFMSKANNPPDNKLAWNDLLKESLKVIGILAGVIGAIKIFG